MFAGGAGIVQMCLRVQEILRCERKAFKYRCQRIVGKGGDA